MYINTNVRCSFILFAMVRLVNCCAVIFLFAVSAECSENKILIHSLNRLLDFLISDSEKVDVDCLFGVVIAEAQLNLLLKRPLEPMKYQQIKKLKDKCRNLINIVQNLVEIPNEEYAKILRAVLRTAGWEVDNDFKQSVLEVLPTLPWVPTEQYLVDVMFEGSPQENESDTCIAELVDLGPPEGEHTCIISEVCDDIIIDMEKPCHGYPLTHKLLYMQVSRAINCSLSRNVFYETTKILCSRIYQEFRTIELLHHEITRDLYLEQIVLCGMEGFTEFLQKPARASMIQWQHSVGCYGSTVQQKPAREPTKRSSVLMTYGCDSHMTGLGAAALALNLRYLEVVN